MTTHDSYANLADLYDSLAAEDSLQTFYREWQDSLLTAIQEYNINVRVMADLACGTGNTAIPWTRQRGWTVIGVDRSSAMLREARKKSSDVQWCRQDITKHSLKHQADVMTCHFDALNHVLTLEDLQKVFLQVALNLKQGGLFQFDLNTEDFFRWLKVHEKLFRIGSNCFMAYNEYDSNRRTATFHQLWFVKTGRLYKKREVKVQERAFSIAEVRQVLKKAGLTLLKLEVQRKLEGKPIRILYLVRKPCG
jgi:ubiquinone/menaquinone biosynthesis C-methylase UbiE